MKSLLLYIFFLITINIHAQDNRLESALHANAAIGMDGGFTPAMQFGAAVNINRLYVATALTLSGDRATPAVADTRMGYILGKTVKCVPYAGYSWQPVKWSAEKEQVIRQQFGPSYGMLLTYALQDSKSSVFLNLHRNTLQPGVTTMLGIKMRLTRGYCD